MKIERNTAIPAPVVERIYTPRTQAPASHRATPARQVVPRHRGTRMANMKLTASPVLKGA